MILINILLVLLIFLILSDLFIKNSPKSKLNLVPINYKIKKKDGLNELIIDLKITNKSKTKETMISNIKFELDFFKNKGNAYCQNFNYQEDIIVSLVLLLLVIFKSIINSFKPSFFLI